MNPDLVIIYLACGSPLGVYQITAERAPRSTVDWARVAAVFIFWPVFAVLLLTSRIFAPPGLDHDRLDHIRREIEKIAFASFTMTRLFEFRETFNRYSGLAEIGNAKPGKPAANELFEAVGHNNKALAARCIARRNRTKLMFHKTRARDEFANLISAPTVETEIAETLFQLSSEMSAILREPAISGKPGTTTRDAQNVPLKPHYALEKKELFDLTTIRTQGRNASEDARAHGHHKLKR